MEDRPDVTGTAETAARGTLDLKDWADVLMNLWINDVVETARITAALIVEGVKKRKSAAEIEESVRNAPGDAEAKEIFFSESTCWRKICENLPQIHRELETTIKRTRELPRKQRREISHVTVPATQFLSNTDRDVAEAILSLWLSGQRKIPFGTIYRYARPGKMMTARGKGEIIESLTRLRDVLRFDFTEDLKNHGRGAAGIVLRAAPLSLFTTH